MDNHTASANPIYGSPTTDDPHPAVGSALRRLTRVLASPECSLVALCLVDEVADVVSDLIDTRPLMPPLTYPAFGADDDEHALRLIRAAIANLETAVAVSEDAQERLRAALAARRLGDVLSRSLP